MASTSGGLLDEEGLRSRLSQLCTEFTVFNRVIFKYKNQHRWAPYFGCLLKMRRDLRLLNAVGLNEILKLAFQVIHEKQPKQMIDILERLKWESNQEGKHTFLDRLLGVARLLSQMVEALIKSAVVISSLLAMNFFTAFALTTLSLLGRFRVLLQQILLDIVSLFNMVSILAKKEQSFQLTHKGVKVFRDFYSANKEFPPLQCVWENGKFCLPEISKSTEKEDSSVNGVKTDGISNIDYETLGVLVEVPPWDDAATTSNGGSASRRHQRRHHSLSFPPVHALLRLQLSKNTKIGRVICCKTALKNSPRNWAILAILREILWSGIGTAPSGRGAVQEGLIFQPSSFVILQPAIG